MKLSGIQDYFHVCNKFLVTEAALKTHSWQQLNVDILHLTCPYLQIFGSYLKKQHKKVSHDLHLFSGAIVFGKAT